MKMDLHIHSKYSGDSLLQPETILKMAKKRGLDGIAVTDHNTIKGSLAVKEANRNDDFKVITGSEIKTDYGDVIGLFIEEEIKSRKYADVVDEIKRQGGLSVLAHPYRKGITVPDELVKMVDAIEVFNARSPAVLNSKAKELSIKAGKPVTAGSDAHVSFEIGNGIVYTTGSSNENVLKNEGTKGVISNYYFVHGLSLSIEYLKIPLLDKFF